MAKVTFKEKGSQNNNVKIKLARFVGPSVSAGAKIYMNANKVSKEGKLKRAARRNQSNTN